MRTAAELIEILDAESNEFTDVFLAVGFESTTLFVQSTDPHRLEVLTDAVEHGGEPVGMIGVARNADSVSVYHRAFRGYADQEWADKYLRGIGEDIADLLANAE